MMFYIWRILLLFLTFWVGVIAWSLIVILTTGTEATELGAIVVGILLVGVAAWRMLQKIE